MTNVLKKQKKSESMKIHKNKSFLFSWKSNWSSYNVVVTMSTRQLFGHLLYNEFFLKAITVWFELNWIDLYFIVVLLFLLYCCLKRWFKIIIIKKRSLNREGETKTKQKPNKNQTLYRINLYLFCWIKNDLYLLLKMLIIDVDDVSTCSTVD